MSSLTRIRVLGPLAAAFLVVSLAYAVQADAAYKAKIDNGTLTLTGDGASDKLVLAVDPAAPGTLLADVGADGTADFSFDRSTFTAVVVKAGAGDDEISLVQSTGIAEEAITLDGGDGNDTLTGANGVETFIGGKGNDVVIGRIGADRVLLGDGDDHAVWNPGDGSDTVDGGNGKDVLDFNGSNIGETIGVTAAGSHVSFTRDIAGIAMDLDGLERIAFSSLVGADDLTVVSVAGTDTKTVAVVLEGSIGGGDGAADTVTAQGTGGADRVTVGTVGGEVVVSGLAAQTSVAGSEAALDHVGVKTLGGADAITSGVGLAGPLAVDVDGGDDADTARFTGTAGDDEIGVAANGAAVATFTPGSTLFGTAAVESLTVLGLGGADTIAGVGNLAALTALTIDGGDGANTLRGGNGADLLLGGAGADVVDGNQGADTALLGDGDDRFEWDPGDGSDSVDGGAGRDALDFFGSNIGETILVVANGGRAKLTRDIASITMDFDNVEDLLVKTLGGADLVVVDDLSGTDVKAVTLDLAAFGGGGDGTDDQVVANGSAKGEVVQIGVDGADAVVSGLPASQRIHGSEAPGDSLLVQTLGGDDDVTVDPAVSGLIKTVVNLGSGE
jgi:Ca2+-binding RTX toxin-like protein